MNIWAIVPVKPLRDSKSRLAHILSADQRAKLTGQMLAKTLKVLGNITAISRTMVISRDPVALKIARRHGASTFGETERQDLNVALTRASHIAAAQKADCVLIVPSDLPFVTEEDIEMMVAAVSPQVRKGNNGYYYTARAMAICTDHNNEGTNALLICPPTGFTFQYGRNSFVHHLEEAERLSMTRRIVHAPGIKFDLDTEDDWHTYVAMQPGKKVANEFLTG